MFIVIEGLDGSGKSTQALLLTRFLHGKGNTVCLRVHPSEENFFGVKARQFLYSRGKNAHFASALFYTADVVCSVLLCAWRKYDYTVFVRYLMGTAYLPSPLHRIAYHFFALVLPKSNLMFFLDTDPEEAYRRISQTRKGREMFESVTELKRVRTKALILASIARWTIIDANKSIDEVRTEIQKILPLS